MWKFIEEITNFAFDISMSIDFINVCSARSEKCVFCLFQCVLSLAIHWAVFLLRLLKDRQRANVMEPSLRHQRRFIKLRDICDFTQYI